uniref:Decaprenyl-diphosphate synthase subunit 1 n=1 Tax=Ascaris lumbricoides TaxID=6252 RepID=A0A0M3HT15_ASCLU
MDLMKQRCHCTYRAVFFSQHLRTAGPWIHRVRATFSHKGGVLIRPLSTYARLRVIRPCLFESTRYATFPALNPEETFKRRSLRLPEFISEKLRKLQYEVVQSLLDQSSLETTADSCDTPSSSKFTQNLQKMAKYYFDQGGKLFRPTVSLLMAHACNQIKPKTPVVESGRETVTANQYKIAVISEMIHTASLVHDDVIDESDVRRGSPTVNAIWGNKMVDIFAVLVGDFILARATQVLCSIARPNVISVMATIIEDLVRGEFMQMTTGSETDATLRFDKYMAKTYSKTASLFANSCKSAAMLADIPEANEEIAFEYGRSLGLAFQLVDDLLDFVSTSAAMGKPTANDLKLGLATAPVLFAAQEHPELNRLISRRFSKDGDVNVAWEMVANSSGVEMTRNMARGHAYRAAKMASKFPNGDSVRDHLVELALCQLDRDR